MQQIVAIVWTGLTGEGSPRLTGSGADGLPGLCFRRNDSLTLAFPVRRSVGGGPITADTCRALDTTHIYWANHLGFSIDAAPLTGGTPTALVTGQPPPVGVAVGP